MPSTITDRMSGLTTSVAVKPPCKAVSIASLTLSGEQTVGGVPCVDGDRVLMAITGGSINNGPWVVRTSAWERAKDFNGSRDVVTGTMILVKPGSADEQFWVVKSLGDIFPGTSSIVIEQHTPEELSLAADLADTTDAANGAGMEGYPYSTATTPAYADNTSGGIFNILRYNDVRLIERIPKSEYAAIAAGTSTYDASPAILQIMADKPGRAIVLPSGKIRINSSLERITNSAATFTEGLKLVGPGSSLCEIDSRVANGYAIKVDTDAVAVARFQRNNIFSGFTLSGATGNPANASGLYLRHAYNILCDDFFVTNFTNDGIVVDVQEGDTDGCNGLIFHRSRIYGCLRWGFANETVSGANEFSFLSMTGTSSITQCGTASAWDPSTGGVPTSGGMKWKGNSASFYNSYFTENYGPALYVPGQAGGALLLTMQNMTFENNGRSSTAAQIYVAGIDGFKINGQIDFRSRDAQPSRYFVFLESTAFAIRGVQIDGMQLQASGAANTTHTAVEARGTNGADIRVSPYAKRDYALSTQVPVGDGVYAGFQGAEIYTDLGKESFATGSQLETVFTAAAPTYTPNTADYAEHVLRLTAGASGTLTLNAPTTRGLGSVARSGRRFTLVISNTSGVTINLSYGFATRGAPTSIANGVIVAAEFTYTPNVGLTQIGAWG